MEFELAKVLFKREEFGKCSEELLGVLQAVATPQHNWWKSNNSLVVNIKFNRGIQVGSEIGWQKIESALQAGRALTLRANVGGKRAIAVATPETIAALGQMPEIQEMALHHSKNDRYLLNSVPNGAIINFNGVLGRVAPTVAPLLALGPTG